MFCALQYLKIISIFLENGISCSKSSKQLKNSIKIKVG